MALSKAEFAAIAEADFLNFDGLEDCNFYKRLDEVGNFDTAVPFSGLQRQGETEDEQYVAATAPGKIAVVWHGLVSDIGEANVRDKIVDSDSRVWIIWRVAKQTFNSRYRFTCIEAHDEPVQ